MFRSPHVNALCLLLIGSPALLGLLHLPAILCLCCLLLLVVRDCDFEVRHKERRVYLLVELEVNPQVFGPFLSFFAQLCSLMEGTWALCLRVVVFRRGGDVIDDLMVAELL